MICACVELLVKFVLRNTYTHCYDCDYNWIESSTGARVTHFQVLSIVI